MVQCSNDDDFQRVNKDDALQALAEHRKALGATDDCCIMCLLASGGGSPEPVWETQQAVVLLDRFGSRPGHLMVIAKDHIQDLTDLSVDAYLDFQRLAHDAACALEGALAPTRIFVASLGAPQAVPMSFPHFHLHVIPLFESDERARPARVFSWTDGVVLYEDDAAERLVRKIRAHFQPSCGPGLRVVGGRG
jgi:diadenosine tetraphosphate (Ap4A) HIT family hydrolase